MFNIAQNRGNRDFGDNHYDGNIVKWGFSHYDCVVYYIYINVIDEYESKLLTNSQEQWSVHIKDKLR